MKKNNGRIGLHLKKFIWTNPINTFFIGGVLGGVMMVSFLGKLCRTSSIDGADKELEGV